MLGVAAAGIEVDVAWVGAGAGGAGDLAVHAGLFDGLADGGQGHELAQADGAAGNGPVVVDREDQAVGLRGVGVVGKVDLLGDGP